MKTDVAAARFEGTYTKAVLKLATRVSAFAFFFFECDEVSELSVAGVFQEKGGVERLRSCNS